MYYREECRQKIEDMRKTLSPFLDKGHEGVEELYDLVAGNGEACHFKIADMMQTLSPFRGKGYGDIDELCAMLDTLALELATPPGQAFCEERV